MSLALRNLAGWGWFWSSTTGVIVLLAMHPLIGLIIGLRLGVRDKRYMDQVMREMRERGGGGPVPTDELLRSIGIESPGRAPKVPVSPSPAERNDEPPRPTHDD